MKRRWYRLGVLTAVLVLIPLSHDLIQGWQAGPSGNPALDQRLRSIINANSDFDGKHWIDVSDTLCGQINTEALEQLSARPGMLEVWVRDGENGGPEPIYTIRPKVRFWDGPGSWLIGNPGIQIVSPDTAECDASTRRSDTLGGGFLAI